MPARPGGSAAGGSDRAGGGTAGSGRRRYGSGRVTARQLSLWDDAAERGRFEAGIVFTDAARIVQVVKYYLARPRERHRIARAGFAIMRGLRSADALLEPVRQLVAGMGCAAAKEAEGQLQP